MWIYGRRGLLIAVVLALAAGWAPAQDVEPSFAELRTRAQQALSARQPASRDRILALGKALAAVDRVSLEDKAWIDLHILTDEVERRLDPMPARSGEAVVVDDWIDAAPDATMIAEKTTAELLRALVSLGSLRVPAGAPLPSNDDRLPLRDALPALDALRAELTERAEVAEGVRRDALLSAANRARDLRFDVECLARGLVPAGRERFEWLLRMRHRVGLDASGAREFGARGLASALVTLASHAAEHGDGMSWQELTETARDRAACATSEELLEFCRTATKEAIDVVVASGLVTVPDAARQPGITLSRHRRPIPYAHYQPGRFDEEGVYRGTAVYTRVPDDLPEADRRARFRDRDRHFMRAVCAHEAVPGHHLQFAIAAGRAGGAWGFGYNSVYVEGWGLYSEELMDRAGFFRDPAEKAALYRMHLWRAVRVLVDVGMHIGEVTPSRAVRMLVEVARLERSAAEAEIARYLDSPTQPLSYLVGATKIREMRNEWIERHGAGREREFHDRFLAFGPIPLDLVDAVLFERRERYDITHP